MMKKWLTLLALSAGLFSTGNAADINRLKTFTGVASQWPWQLNADGTWTFKRPDASDVTFTQSGTGAVARSVGSALSDWYSVNSYSSIPAAFAASPTFSSVAFPVGTYSLNSPLVLKQSQSLTSMAGAFPLFVYYGTSGTAITTNSNGSNISGIYIRQDGTPPGTTGIALGAGEQGRRGGLRDVTVDQAFDIGINGVSNTFRHLTNVLVNSTGSTGIVWQNTYNADAGDDSWSGVTVSGPTGDLVRYNSGGGLKITGYKGLGGTNGFNLNILDGLVTQDLLFTGSSIENSSTNCMIFQSTGTGTFYNIVVVGNQFYNCPTGINVKGGGTPSGIISGNTFSSIGSSSVTLENGANEWTIGRNNYHGVFPVDNRDDFNVRGSGIDWRHILPLNTSSATPKAFDEIQFHTSNSAQYESAKVQVYIQGLLQGCGAIGRLEEGILTNNAGSITYTSLRSTHAGACDVAFSVDASTAYKATLKYALSGGTQFLGTATIDIDGSIKTVVPK